MWIRKEHNSFFLACYTYPSEPRNDSPKLKIIPDLLTLTVSPCVTRFHILSHGLTVRFSFLMVLQILSGFSLRLTVF